VYRAEDREIRIEARGGGLVLREADIEAPLEREPFTRSDRMDVFHVVHDGFDRYGLAFGRDATGEVVEAFHGPSWLRKQGHVGPEPTPAPDEWRRYEGVYRSNDPWAPALRIFVRREALTLQWPAGAEEHVLTQLDDGSFAAGDPALPRRLRFEGDAAGLAVVAHYNGGRWYRSFEDDG
jgi:hypothetical protein